MKIMMLTFAVAVAEFTVLSPVPETTDMATR
jgi:hypothetical protein